MPVLRSRRFWIGLIIQLTTLVLLGREIVLQPDGRLRLHVLDVGQGDALLIVTPTGKQVLIDGGPDLSVLEQIGRFMPFFDRTIELLVLTHPDSDHLTALPEIMKRYHIASVALTGVSDDLPWYQALLEHIIAQQVPVIQLDPDRDIVLEEDTILDVLWPPVTVFDTTPKENNRTSAVIALRFASHYLLLTGDIGEAEETALLQSGIDLTSEVLKVAHHGSKTSSSTGFLLAVDPDIALISVGRMNTYGHPHPSILRRLKDLGIRVLTTAESGTLSLVCSRSSHPCFIE